MDCKNTIDSQYAHNNEGYIFYCALKNAMVNYRDCQKCKHDQFKAR